MDKHLNSIYSTYVTLAVIIKCSLIYVAGWETGSLGDILRKGNAENEL